MFYHRSPHIIVVDSFLADPDMVRNIALQQEFHEDIRGYKGVRSKPFRWPFLKEEFERLIGAEITDWISQSQNGVFQKTWDECALVTHSDSQHWAGAIYLNPNAPLDSGTSFWRHKTHGCRRPPNHPFEDKVEWRAIQADMYSEYNLLHEDNWELVDKVANIYGRLVLWQGSLVHRATSYQGFTKENPRLAQLWFFCTKTV